MSADETGILRALNRLLTGKRGVPGVAQVPGETPEAARARRVHALLTQPEVLAAFPETAAALEALSQGAPRGRDGISGRHQHPLPELLPPALSLREASALLARAAEPPQTLDVYEALTRHGLRRPPPDHSVE